MNYWIKGGLYVSIPSSLRQVGWLLLGNGGLFISMLTFPLPERNTISEWLSTLIFSPFSLLGAILAFIGGFLAFSVVVRTILMDILPSFPTRKLTGFTILKVIAIATSFLFLGSIQLIVALVGFVFSVAYGIMDLDFEKEQEPKGSDPY